MRIALPSCATYCSAWVRGTTASGLYQTKGRRKPSGGMVALGLEISAAPALRRQACWVAREQGRLPNVVERAEEHHHAFEPCAR
eukprot:scaffold19097_cov95-Isochrysis_galbana.AAC.5